MMVKEMYDMPNVYVPATQPTIYFIGVTTGSSSIMKVFPKWAKALGLNDAVIKGIDFKQIGRAHV